MPSEVSIFDAYAPYMDTIVAVVNDESIEYDDLRCKFGGHGMVDKEWQDRVKGILKSELKRRNLSYKQLSEKLKEIGVEETERNIKNKVSRGGFTAVFFVQCLVAVGVQTVRLSEE